MRKQRSEDEMIEDFMSRDLEEIRELFKAHEAIRKWFVEACENQLHMLCHTSNFQKGAKQCRYL